MVKRLSPARALVAGIVLLAVVGVVLWVTPSQSYLFLPDRAHPVAPLLTVAGEKAPTDGGGIYFVDVVVRKATLLERLFPGIRSGSSLVPGSAVNPPGVSDAARHKQDVREMARSQSIAAAVALRALGYKVVARPTGVLISAVAPDAPAAGKLQPTDVIVSVDGQPVRTPADLRRLIGRHRPGETVRIGLRRGNVLHEVVVGTIPDPRAGGRPVVGILPAQAADIRLPVAVRINAGNVGGPSAGLAFALDLLEELGRDVDHGYRVAVTGELELSGKVDPIGGVRQKTIGARQSRIDVFLVPAGDNARDAQRYANGLRIIPVTSFQQALRALATLPPKR